jgi:hypothetical protein
MTISLKYLTQDTQMKGLHTAGFIILTTIQPQGGEVLIGLFLWITIIRILPLSLYSFVKNIIFYFFPIPPLTHRLQPLYSVPFQQLKGAHSAKVNVASQFRGERYKKVEFLYDIPGIRDKALTPPTIEAGWQETGIRPFNPSLVLQKMGFRQMMIRIYCEYMTGTIQLRILKSFLRLMPLLPPPLLLVVGVIVIKHHLHRLNRLPKLLQLYVQYVRKSL